MLQPRRRAFWCALAAFVAASGAATARAQFVPAAPPAAEPGTSLPPFTVDFPDGSWTFDLSPSLQVRATILTNGVISGGDVRVSADTIEYDQRTSQFVASGNVLLTRGDETLRASRFVFDPETGIGMAENAIAVSPPFYVSGGRIERRPGGIFARDALLTACPEGRGEVRLMARSIEVVENEYLLVRDARVYLYGTRLFTIRRIRRGLGPRARNEENPLLALPVRVRASGISGFVVGLGTPFSLSGGVAGDALVEFPTRYSAQLTVTLRRDLIGPPRPKPVKNAPNESPLRRFLRARPLPPPRDPILDFEDISPLADPISFPTRGSAPRLETTFAATLNRDVNSKRRARLLLSQLPAAQISGAFPLGRANAAPVPAGREAGRAALRKPRVQVGGEVSVGSYRERTLAVLEGKTVLAGTRTALRASATGEVGLLPLLVGDHLLLRPRLRLTLAAYDEPGLRSYRVAETDFAADYVFGARAFVGLRYVRRFEDGRTPFVFDAIDTRNEVQASAQTSLGGNGRYTFAVLLRYDTDERRLFDYELTLAQRGRCIEPRLSYRKLGGQILFNVAFPGLTLR